MWEGQHVETIMPVAQISFLLNYVPLCARGSLGDESELRVGVCDDPELYFFFQIGLMHKIPIFCKETTAGGKLRK